MFADVVPCPFAVLKKVELSDDSCRFGRGLKSKPKLGVMIFLSTVYPTAHAAALENPLEIKCCK